MKKKKTLQHKPELYKLQKGITPKKRTLGKKKSKATLQIEELLRAISPGQSFLIKKNQEATVRRFLKQEDTLYKITVGATTEGDDFKRVFCLEKKQVKKIPKK